MFIFFLSFLRKAPEREQSSHPAEWLREQVEHQMFRNRLSLRDFIRSQKSKFIQHAASILVSTTFSFLQLANFLKGAIAVMDINALLSIVSISVLSEVLLIFFCCCFLDREVIGETKNRERLLWVYPCQLIFN